MQNRHFFDTSGVKVSGMHQGSKNICVHYLAIGGLGNVAALEGVDGGQTTVIARLLLVHVALDLRL